MRKWGLALALACAVPMSACVQMKQYADVQFTPPQGNYKLLVLRPDVSVSSLTTGGIPEPRADWTEQARKHIVDAVRAQQATRGGEVKIYSDAANAQAVLRVAHHRNRSDGAQRFRVVPELA